MDWQLLSIVPAIFLGIVMVVMLYGSFKMWKMNKFLSLILLAVAVAVGIGFYAIYGKRFFG